MSDLDLALEAEYRSLRYYLKLLPWILKLLPWILLVLMVTVGVTAVVHGENPYVTFALLGGLYVLVEAGRWFSGLRGAALTRSMVRISARSLVDLATLLAGCKRQASRTEWRAHLGGESGHDPATWPKVRQALGFVVAALRLRLADIAYLAWQPADAILASRTLSNLFVGGPVIVVLFAIVHHDGRFGLVADIQDPGELGAFLYGVIRTGRWWRDVKPPPPKARRAEDATASESGREGTPGA